MVIEKNSWSQERLCLIFADVGAGVQYVVRLCLNIATSKYSMYCSSRASHRAPPDQRYQLELEYLIIVQIKISR